MSADEIIKHIPEIAAATKGVAALGAAIPFTAVVKRMLGPAADELAEMWRDQVRLYRYERQLKCVEKAEKMAKDAGFAPQAVPPKILFPLLEGASFEEDENLHDMWAALLANAASPENGNVVRPGFIAILREMAPDEAQVLNWMFEHSKDSWLVTGKRFHWSEYAHHVRSSQEFDTSRKLADGTAVVVCFQRLNSVMLIRVEDDKYVLTSLGYQFLTVCRPPTPKP
jgi:Abortive infection alpha